MKQAFDCVWHVGLLLKIKETQIPDYYVCLIASFLQNSTIHVRIDNALSRVRHIAACIPSDGK